MLKRKSCRARMCSCAKNAAARAKTVEKLRIAAFCEEVRQKWCQHAHASPPHRKLARFPRVMQNMAIWWIQPACCFYRDGQRFAASACPHPPLYPPPVRNCSVYYQLIRGTFEFAGVVSQWVSYQHNMLRFKSPPLLILPHFVCVYPDICSN